MTGANLNMDKMKEFMSKYANETSNTRMFQDLDSCSDQGKGFNVYRISRNTLIIF